MSCPCLNLRLARRVIAVEDALAKLRIWIMARQDGHDPREVMWLEGHQMFVPNHDERAVEEQLLLFIEEVMEARR